MLNYSVAELRFISYAFEAFFKQIYTGFLLILSDSLAKYVMDSNTGALFVFSNKTE